MQIEIDLSLKNPLDLINIESIIRYIIKDNNYRINHYCKHNFILIKVEENNFKIRIHEDGRCYIIKEIQELPLPNEVDIIAHMFKSLDRFLGDAGLKVHLTFKHELRFTFRGYLAQNLLWKNYFQIKKLGEYFLGSNIMRIYEHDNSISVTIS